MRACSRASAAAPSAPGPSPPRVRRRRHRRPSTTYARPARCAAAGVTTRAWSCARRPPAGRPGRAARARSPNARPHGGGLCPLQTTPCTPAAARQLRQAQHLVLDVERIGAAPRRARARGIERRQHGHRRARRSRRPPPSTAASSIAVPPARAPSAVARRARRAPHGARDRVRDVVELEVEKDVARRASRSARTIAGPAAVNSSLPTL